MSRERSDDVMTVTGCLDGDTVAFYAHGHLPRGVFIRAVEHYAGPDVVPEWKELFRAEGIAFEWWRKVPDRTGEMDSRLVKARPKVRGAFPVTVLNLEEWDR